MLSEIPSRQYQGNKGLKAALHYPYFLMIPLAPTSFIKISGTAGEVEAQWRHHENKDIQRITRKLDAFAHFVFHESKGTILIS